MKVFCFFTKSLLLFALLLSCVFLYFHTISAFTQDLGRHLLLGKIILQTHAVPQTNLFSYTNPNFPFINTHWLSEVFFFIFSQTVGTNGLLIITTGIAVGTFALALLYSHKHFGFLPTIITGLLSLGILSERTDIRPEIFSYLFLLLFILILYRFIKHPSRQIFFLIPIQLLWVNIHVSFIIGIAVIGLFLCSDVLIHHYNIQNKKLHLSTKLLIITFFTTAAISLINPNSASGALYPFRVLQNYGYSIEENQTVFFLWSYSQKQTIIYFWVYVFLLFSTLLLRIKQTKPIDWLLALFFTGLAISAIRHFPLFVYGTFFILAASLSVLIKNAQALFAPLVKEQKTILSSIFFLLLTFAVFWQTKTNFEKHNFGFGVEKGAEKATDFFVEKHLKGPIFNNFDIGSYILYRLYPTEKVFIDGRPEAYPAAFIQNTYIPMQENESIFAKEDKTYRFNTIFFSHTDMTPWAKTFLQTIVKNNKWQVVYLDEMVIILIKKAPGNNELLGKHSVSLQNFTPKKDATVQDLTHLILFFDKISLPNKELQIAQTLLKKDPNSCLGLYISAVLFTKMQSVQASVYTNRYNFLCQ